MSNYRCLPFLYPSLNIQPTPNLSEFDTKPLLFSKANNHPPSRSRDPAVNKRKLVTTPSRNKVNTVASVRIRHQKT
jgi:hypothetical protein